MPAAKPNFIVRRSDIGERLGIYKMALKFMILSFCLALSGCDIPKLFWEEETRQVVDDVVTEEEKLNHDHDHPTNR